MPVPELPTHQDCHELWSKKRRRQLREAENAVSNQPMISVSREGSIPSLPGSEKSRHACRARQEISESRLKLTLSLDVRAPLFLAVTALIFGRDRTPFDAVGHIKSTVLISEL